MHLKVLPYELRRIIILLLPLRDYYNAQLTHSYFHLNTRDKQIRRDMVPVELANDRDWLLNEMKKYPIYHSTVNYRQWKECLGDQPILGAMTAETYFWLHKFQNINCDRKIVYHAIQYGNLDLLRALSDYPWKKIFFDWKRLIGLGSATVKRRKLDLFYFLVDKEIKFYDYTSEVFEQLCNTNLMRLAEELVCFVNARGYAKKLEIGASNAFKTASKVFSEQNIMKMHRLLAWTSISDETIQHCLSKACWRNKLDLAEWFLELMKIKPVTLAFIDVSQCLCHSRGPEVINTIKWLRARNIKIAEPKHVYKHLFIRGNLHILKALDLEFIPAYEAYLYGFKSGNSELITWIETHIPMPDKVP